MASRFGSCARARPPRALEHGPTHRERQRRDQSRARPAGRHDCRGPPSYPSTPLLPRSIISFCPTAHAPLIYAMRRQDINAGLREACFARETVKIALPLTLVDAAAVAGPPLISPRTRTGRSFDGSLRVRMAARWWPPTPTPMPKKADVIIDSDSGTLESEATSRSPAPPPRRRLSLTQKCGVKIVPLANAFSKLSSSFSSSSHSPSRSAAAGSVKDWPRDASSSVTSRLMSASSSSCCPLPAEPPPPYQLRVANPAPEYPAAPMSSSRFTAASVEAVRAPDSPVPTFPSPKLSTESVFGSTESLASLPAGNGTVASEPRCTGRNTAVRGAGLVLRRKETIRFGLSSGYLPT